MTTEIIHTGRAGTDKARQGRKEPGRDGKGRAEPDSARQVQARVGKCRAVLDSAKQDRYES